MGGQVTYGVGSLEKNKERKRKSNISMELLNSGIENRDKKIGSKQQASGSLKFPE